MYHNALYSTGMAIDDSRSHFTDAGRPFFLSSSTNPDSLLTNRKTAITNFTFIMKKLKLFMAVQVIQSTEFSFLLREILECVGTAARAYLDGEIRTQNCGKEEFRLKLLLRALNGQFKLSPLPLPSLPPSLPP